VRHAGKPGIGGINGREPVATTNRRALIGRPATVIRPGAVEAARPSATSIPSPRSAAAFSVAAIAATTSRTGCAAVVNGSPRRADSMRVFEGAQ